MPNGFYDVDTVDICVFTKDPQKEYRSMFKKEFPNVKVCLFSLFFTFHNYLTNDIRLSDYLN